MGRWADRFRELLAGFEANDFGGYERAFAPEATLEILGTSPIAGTYRGLTQIVQKTASFRRWIEPGTVEIVVEDERERSLVITEDAALRPEFGGRQMRFDAAVAFDADGRITRVVFSPQDPEFDRVVAGSSPEPRTDAAGT
jgi:hypothetical protein